MYSICDFVCVFKIFAMRGNRTEFRGKYGVGVRACVRACTADGWSCNNPNSRATTRCVVEEVAFACSSSKVEDQDPWVGWCGSRTTGRS